eukprot:gene16573-18258_t
MVLQCLLYCCILLCLVLAVDCERPSLNRSRKRCSISEPIHYNKTPQKNCNANLGDKRTTKLKYGELEHVQLDDDYVKGSLWPKPQEEHPEDVYFSIDHSNFKFRATGKTSNILSSAFERYRSLTFPKTTNAAGNHEHSVIIGLEVNVRTEEAELKLDMDESYNLIVNAPSSSLQATTIWGALRGLETFSQLVYRNNENKYFAKKTRIVDRPRFKHRGFLIDTSRHYLSVKTIEKFLDAMSYSKFNVLHWHIVDDPAFPFVSKTFPELSNKGATNTRTHVYTPDNVKHLIHYARNRGIRVIPEFDTPGHTQSWKAIDGLLTDCGNGNYGPIDPTKDKNYQFLTKLFSEVAEVFPDKYVHLGADEVDFTCWKQSKTIKDWMKSHSIETYEKLEQYYAEKLIKIVDNLQKHYIVWQDIFDNNVELDSNTVVNVWVGNWKEELTNITKKGHKAILSACWYLNYINYGMDWPEFYFCDPEEFQGTEEQKRLVIGGTAAMWGEYVDATNILSRTWARGLAVGERLWSAKSVRNAENAMQRIWEHRCRYISRGIPAEPVVKGKFCLEEWEN